MKKIKEPHILLVIFIIMLLIPIFIRDAYWIQVLVVAEIKTLLVISLFLLCGMTGQMSLGHAGFYAIGAYTSALLNVNLRISPWITVLIGAVFAAFAGLLIGYPALRLKGPYLIIATVGFGEIIRLIAVNWISVTKGPMGVTGIRPLTGIGLGPISLDFNNKLSNYYFLILLLVVVTFLAYNLVNSRTGIAMKAIRDDDIAAEVMGINLAYYKVLSFTLSAGLAGLAGGFYAHYMRFISPDSFTLAESQNYMILLLVGGSASILGPFIGGLGISSLLESLRILSDYRMIAYGVILFLVILFMPKGIAGMLTGLTGLVVKKADKIKPPPL